MRHPLRRSRWLAAIGAAALLAAGCGGGVPKTKAKATTGRATMTPTPPVTAEDPFTKLKAAADQLGPGGTSQAFAAGMAQAARLPGNIKAPAAQLHARLSAFLQEHVYWVGIAIDMGLGFGFDGQAYAGAAATLDANTTALSQLIGQVAPHEEENFRGRWREHIRYLTDYTRGSQQAALRNLDRSSQEIGALLARITGGAVPAEAIVENLKGHTQQEIAMIDAAVDTAIEVKLSVFQKLKQASDHVHAGGWSKALAAGLARAAELEGDLDAPAVGMYVRLANLLEEHAYLTEIAIKTGYTAGYESRGFKAASAVLDQNTVALGNLIGSVTGDRNTPGFVKLWREHIDFFHKWAKAAAARDEGGKQQALADLNRFRQDAGAFFDHATGGVLHPAAVLQELEVHVERMTEMIDALGRVMVVT